MGQEVPGDGSVWAEAWPREAGPVQGPLKRPVDGADPPKDSHEDTSRILRESSEPGTNPVLRGPDRVRSAKDQRHLIPTPAPQIRSKQRMWGGERAVWGQEPLEEDRPKCYSPHTGCVTTGPPATSLSLRVLRMRVLRVAHSVRVRED